MTNLGEGICATTCCGKQPNPPVIKPACSPRCCLQKNAQEKKEIKCTDEDLVSLPNLHDIYCMKERVAKLPDRPPNLGKPKISPKNETKVKQMESDVFNVFRQMLQLYKADEIMFAFNGGKDCTVVLDMLSRFYRMVSLSSLKIPVLYVYSEDSFPEVNEFVENCVQRYPIELFKYKGPMKKALSEILKKYRNEDFQNLKACVMGLRSSDPYCQDLKIMQFTDPDWPPLMRINPILEWTYCDIWNYILYYDVPYCPLYNQGYTSLGTKSNTIRNDLLKCKNAVCKNAYFPAYELIDGSMERAGRIPLSAGGFKLPSTDDAPELYS